MLPDLSFDSFPRRLAPQRTSGAPSVALIEHEQPMVLILVGASFVRVLGLLADGDSFSLSDRGNKIILLPPCCLLSSSLWQRMTKTASWGRLGAIAASSQESRGRSWSGPGGSHGDGRRDWIRMPFQRKACSLWLWFPCRERHPGPVP